MEFLVVLEEDEDGNVVADVPQLPGCHTEGRTKEEALRNVREAIQLYLEVEGPPHSKLLGVEHVSVNV